MFPLLYILLQLDGVLCCIEDGVFMTLMTPCGDYCCNSCKSDWMDCNLSLDFACTTSTTFLLMLHINYLHTGHALTNLTEACSQDQRPSRKPCCHQTAFGCGVRALVSSVLLAASERCLKWDLADLGSFWPVWPWLAPSWLPPKQSWVSD